MQQLKLLGGYFFTRFPLVILERNIVIYKSIRYLLADSQLQTISFVIVTQR